MKVPAPPPLRRRRPGGVAVDIQGPQTHQAAGCVPLLLGLARMSQERKAAELDVATLATGCVLSRIGVLLMPCWMDRSRTAAACTALHEEVAVSCLRAVAEWQGLESPSDVFNGKT